MYVQPADPSHEVPDVMEQLWGGRPPQVDGTPSMDGFISSCTCAIDPPASEPPPTESAVRLLAVGGRAVLSPAFPPLLADAKVNNKAGSGGGAAIMQCFSPDHVPVMYAFRALLAFRRANSVCACDNVQTLSRARPSR